MAPVSGMPGALATLENWRNAPFNQWAFHHVREVIPSADIANDAFAVSPLSELGAEIPGAEAFFAATQTDGLLVLHRGRIALERYANGMTRETPHILMSVSKSMLGLLAGILAARGALRIDAPIGSIVAELRGTAYDDATVRHLLDMRAGIAFEEDYLATSGPMVAYRKSTGWNALEPGEMPSDLHTFLPQLKQRDGPHGGPFKYTSPNTDLLGWVIERATGRRYADLMSELLWKPLGAERSGYITVDRLGAPRCAGGMCVVLRDLARVGQLVLDQGRINGKQVIPSAWLEDIENQGDPEAWEAGNLAEYFRGRSIAYRSKWYVLRGATPLLFGWGIHGQHVFIDRKHQTVVAKQSSQALAIDSGLLQRTLDFVSSTGAFLASR